MELDEVFKDRLKTLADEKRAAKILIGEIENQHASQSVNHKEARNVIEDRIKEFKRGWAKAQPALQKRLLSSVFDVITLDGSGLNLFYYFGSTEAMNVHGAENKKPSEDLSEGLSFKTWDETVSRSSFDEIGRGYYYNAKCL